jgi:hypothetical protein
VLAIVLASSTAHADIVSTVGLTQITAPTLVTGSFLINDGLPSQIIFPEQQNITLAAPLVTDTGVIPAGTVVDSYFFALNSAIEYVVNTSVTFSTNVLGAIYKDPTNPYGNPSLPFYPLFTASNFLGTTGTTYTLEGAIACGPFCAFETITAPDMDTLTVAGNTVFFHNDYSVPGDFARIIVQSAAPVPGPIVGTGLPGLLGLFSFLGWKWRRELGVEVQEKNLPMVQIA